MEQERAAPGSRPGESRVGQQLAEILLGRRQRGPTDGCEAERGKLLKPDLKCGEGRFSHPRGDAQHAAGAQGAANLSERPDGLGQQEQNEGHQRRIEGAWPERETRRVHSSHGNQLPGESEHPRAMSMPKSEARGAAQAMSGSSAPTPVPRSSTRRASASGSASSSRTACGRSTGAHSRRYVSAPREKRAAVASL